MLLTLSFFAHWISIFTAISLPQTAPDKSVHSIKLAPGVVVEKVEPGSQAQKAGIRTGDILLQWERGSGRGQIKSPFDLLLAEIEQAPIGDVTLDAFRADVRRWTIGPGAWGIQARPNFQGPMLFSYLRCRSLSRAKLNEAAACWEGLAAAAKEPGFQWVEAWFLLREAESLARDKQTAKENAVYNRAAEIAGDVDSRLAAQTFRAWAQSLDEQNELEESEKRYEQATSESEKSAGDDLLVALNLQDLSFILYKRGDLAAAEERQRRALEIRERLARESLVVSNSLNILGIVTELQDKLDESEQFYNHALEIRQRLMPESLAVANVLNNLGNLASNRGDLDQAERYYRRSVEIRQKLSPGSTWPSGILRNLGNLALNQADFNTAREYHHQALEIDIKISPGSLDVASDLHNLGLVARRQNDLEHADQYNLEALRIWRKVAPGSLEEAATLGVLGSIACDRGDLERAEQYYEQELEITGKISPEGVDTATLLTGLGDVDRKRGDFTQAEQHYRKAIIIWDRLAPEGKEIAEALASLASVLRDQQEPKQAADLYEQAVNVLDFQVEHLGGSEDAGWNFRAISGDFYKDYIDLLIEQKRPEEAFRVLERSRARGLLEILANAHIDIQKGIEPALLKQRRRLREEIDSQSDRRIELFNQGHSEEQVIAVQNKIGELLGQYRVVEEKIRAASPAYAALKQPLGVNELQQQLRDGKTLLLEYSLGEVRSYVFAISGNDFSVFELPGRRQIETAARNLYFDLTARNRIVKGETDFQAGKRWRHADARYPKLAAELSKMILAPVTSLSGYKRLVVVSEGPLQYVPFAVLPLPQEVGGFASAATRVISSEQPIQRQTKPLILNHEIVSLPSASVIAELRDEEQSRPEPKMAVAVIADPVFDLTDKRVGKAMAGELGKRQTRLPGLKRSSPESLQLSLGRLTRAASEIGYAKNGQIKLKRLEYARREAEAILAVAPREKAMVALDFAATRAAAMSGILANYRVVHFATHGLLNNAHPNLSGLIFSLVDKNGDPQDGFLELRDIYNLNLPVDLVVLSGCETGLGKEVKGEGLIGLTRGFMYAGASRVMASLWSVSDQATAELMSAFYKAMEQDKMSPSAALQVAQVELLKQDIWKSPYYWAAFQIQGEWL